MVFKITKYFSQCTNVLRKLVVLKVFLHWNLKGCVMKSLNHYNLKSSINNFDPTLQNCLFGEIELIKNSDIAKYEYAGYGIGFDSKGTFSHPSGIIGVNVIIFGADMSSSAHANNKTKNVLILCDGFTQGLEDTTLYAEKKYSLNFTATRKKFCFEFVL